MREFKALIALGDLLCGEETTPKARAAFDCAHVTFFKEVEPPASRIDQHQLIYRRWAAGMLEGGWLQVAEKILQGHAATWIDYVASLNAEDLSVNDRLSLLLVLKESPCFFPEPNFGRVAKALNDEAGLERNSPASAKRKPRQTRPADGPPAPSMDAPSVASRSEFFTQSQAHARTRILALGQLYFDGSTAGSLRPRTSVLLVAATGAGKTSLVCSVANALGAHLLRLTVADWIPCGANRDLTPALLEVAEALAAHPRIVVFIDEMDKLVDDGKSWSRSSATEILNILERNLPESVFSLMRKSADKRPLIEQRLKSGMYIVGAGAWQSLHQNRPKSVGFHGTCPVEASSDLLLRAIHSTGFPSELLGRFHTCPISLPYPTSDETKEIFDRLGITRLAARVGLEHRLQAFSWAPFGFRSLESVWADLLLAEQELRLSHGPNLPSEDNSDHAS